MTHEQFITLETAKLAKQAGYRWDGVTYAWYKGNLIPFSLLPKGNKFNLNDYYAAPTQSVLQRWLREIKGISIEVCHVIVWVDGGTLGNKWTYRICYLNSNESDILSSDEFNTYEDALEAGLRKYLTLLVEKQ